MDIKQIDMIVDEYEHDSGIEAQNYRQLTDDITPDAVAQALQLDINWHTDNTQELTSILDRAVNVLGPELIE